MLILHYKRNSGLGSTPEATMELTGKVPVPGLEGAFLWRKKNAEGTRMILPQNPETNLRWNSWVYALQLGGTLGAQAPDSWFSHGVGDRKTTQKRGWWVGPHSLNVNCHCH